MLGQVYQDMSIDELILLLNTAKKSGSASVQDFKDLIIKKFAQKDSFYQAFVQESGGWGFISDTVADLRHLLMEYNLYIPNRKSEL